ncbi:hypothetical protein BRC86_06320 [Halobacteriales archaeon QS_3_64_16]|nr:MAG: hypothetical protein BRC86_06320 [Halobacteriales archaeon QS_3_64_16]
MTGCVYTLHSTLELPLEDVHEFLEDPDLPGEIEDIDLTRRNNTLIISAVATDTDISKYTPMAQLKASVTENRVYEEPPEKDEDDDGPITWGRTPPRGPSGPRGPDEEEEEINSKLVEYACFKGDRETVLQNTALQYPMFEVLCNLARVAEKGTLTAISARDKELKATRIVDGEDRPVSIDVVEDPREREGKAEGVNWRNNEFIS